MIAIAIMGQAETIPADIFGADLTPAVLASLLISAVLGAMVGGLLLKVVAGSILGYPVRYGSAVTVLLVVILIQLVFEILVRRIGLVDAETLGNAQRSGRFIDQLMPLGFAAFILAQAIGVALLAWAIRTFLRGPDQEIPSWINAFLVSGAMMALLLAFSYGVSRFAMPA
jgi:hypothetical protein